MFKPQEKFDDSVITIILPQTPSIRTSLLGLVGSRRLLFYFAARMIRMRYSGTILGWLWLFIRPLITALFFTVVFGNLIKMPSDEIPYLIFFFSGMIVWSFFSGALLFMTRSLRSNKRLITKLYFPKIIVPIASVAPFLLELLIYGTVFIGVILFYWLGKGVFYLDIRPAFLWSIYFLLLTFLLMVGIGLWTSVLNSQARDVRFTLPYVLQMWFFITPVIYPLSLVPEEWRWLIPFNPMAVAVEGFRWSLLGVGGVSGTDMAAAGIQILLVFLSGVWFFSKAEAKLADSF